MALEYSSVVMDIDRRSIYLPAVQPDPERTLSIDSLHKNSIDKQNLLANSDQPQLHIVNKIHSKRTYLVDI